VPTIIAHKTAIKVYIGMNLP